MGTVPFHLIGVIVAIIVVVIILFIIVRTSFTSIKPDEIRTIEKKFGKKLNDKDGFLIGLNKEAGYQPELLKPGWHFMPAIAFRTAPAKIVSIPPGCIGVVEARVGKPLTKGFKTAEYNEAFGNFEDVRSFLQNGGQRGIQRHVLPPGFTGAIHPVAFRVKTVGKTYGMELGSKEEERNEFSSMSDDLFHVTRIGAPRATDRIKDAIGEDTDYIGVVTILDGPSADSNDIVSRIGGFQDVIDLEAAAKAADPSGEADPNELLSLVTGNKNALHNSYQDFEKFLQAGGRMGMQHDTLTWGEYLLNPFLVSVEVVKMLVVDQSSVAVIMASAGLASEDLSGDAYKFGSIVATGHRGVWMEPLRTGKYALNPHIYRHEPVPTSILTLNWAQEESEAHELDKRLSSIKAKSKEAFEFSIDLQVQIHVPEKNASRVIVMVGTMQNLVSDVLQSAVGNYIRNSLQGLAATKFIETRQEVQTATQIYVAEFLAPYDLEVKGVYIQDVIYPQQLVDVMTKREIATQEVATYAAEQTAQKARVELEAQRGQANMQQELASANVSVQINEAKAKADIAAAEGNAKVITLTSEAEATKITSIGKANAGAREASGLAEAKAYEAQKEAVGEQATTMIALVKAIGDGSIKITPDIVVSGGDSGSSNGLSDLILTQFVAASNGSKTPSSDGVTTPVVGVPLKTPSKEDAHEAAFDEMQDDSTESNE